MWLNIHRLSSLISVITLRRLFNLIKLYLAHYRASWSSKVTLLPPYALSLEISSVCNLKCPQCPVGLGDINRTKKMMSPVFAKEVISRFAHYGIVVNLYFQGESLLHPEFFHIAAFARSKKLYTILSTNGTIINKDMAKKLVNSGINRIIISADGLSQETYGQYRAGGDAEKVWNGIALLKKARIERQSVWPEIIVQTLVNRYNENELAAIRKKATVLGADSVKFKTMQIYNDHEHWVPRNKRFTRYIGKEMMKKPKGHCFRSLSGMVVSADENFLPCCYDKQAEHNLGAKLKDFNAIVRSTARKTFLQQIYTEKSMHSICQNCPEGMHVYKKNGKP